MRLKQFPFSPPSLSPCPFTCPRPGDAMRQSQDVDLIFRGRTNETVFDGSPLTSTMRPNAWASPWMNPNLIVQKVLRANQPTRTCAVKNAFLANMVHSSFDSRKPHGRGFHRYSTAADIMIAGLRKAKVNARSTREEKKKRAALFEGVGLGCSALPRRHRMPGSTRGEQNVRRCGKHHPRPGIARERAEKKKWRAHFEGGRDLGAARAPSDAAACQEARAASRTSADTENRPGIARERAEEKKMEGTF
ncbi:hypothetical protein B0H19DRAFT_1083698 [Mycena capillaripes]|nr:hypothetical protein B0H19DRAFT_1083698 [Mycena capillaripes]